MPALLIYRVGEKEHKKTLMGPFTTIGRVETNDIFLNDPRISRNHSVLRRIGADSYYLIDMGSKNGTYLNGKRIIVPSLLKAGDEIKVGSNSLTFEIEAEEKPSTNDFHTRDSKTTTASYESLGIKEITVLVADISDYTTMSGQLSLSFLTKVLGNWFRSANDVVEKNKGSVDKFIGDAVMACWLIPEDDPKESIKQTLKAALDLHKMTEELNLANPLLPRPLEIRIGINTGKAVLSDLGLGSSQDHTVLGDSVNLAFRLEKAAKELEADLAMGYDSYKYLEGSITERHKHIVNVKGKDDPIRVCALKFDELPEILLSAFLPG